MPLICASRELNPWVLAIIDGPCEPKWMHAVLFLIKQELRTLHQPLASDYPGKTTSISTKVSLQMLALVTFPARCSIVGAMPVTLQSCLFARLETPPVAAEYCRNTPASLHLHLLASTVPSFKKNIIQGHNRSTTLIAILICSLIQKTTGPSGCSNLGIG